MALKAFSKGGTLLAFTAVEMLAPFMRMIILTHVLGGFELGFSAALSAAYATVEQVTDTGLFRFVLATPRDQYRQALSVAHGMSVIRGVVVGLLFLALAYPTACTMVACDQWESFACLGMLTFIKSLENLEIRIYERDYRYAPQLIASISSHSSGLIAMALVGLETRTHHAVLAYLFTQSIVYVILSHVLAKSPISARFGGPLMSKMLHFSLPLMINGTGNALMGQGDRLFVGAFLGLEQLGLYAVMILTSYVPTTLVYQLANKLFLAGFMNSTGNETVYRARMKLYSRVIPMIATIYAVGWIALGPVVIPLVFGSRFVVSNSEVLLISFIVYLRICRAEPAQSLLIQNHLTKRLAVGNQVPVIGLLLGGLLVAQFRTLEALLSGMVVGEVLAVLAMIFMARKVWHNPWIDGLTWIAALLVFPVVMGVALMQFGPGLHLAARVGVGLAIGVFVLILAAVAALPLFRQSYRRA